MGINRHFGHLLEVEADTDGRASESSQEAVIVAFAPTYTMSLGIEGESGDEC